MADNLLLPISLEQMTGSDGEVFVSAVYVYDAGTTDLKNVYTDATLSTAAANPIIADGDGVIPARYIGTGSYKLVIKNTVGYPTEDLSAHWTTFKTVDNLPGALDTSSYSSDEATPITPVVSKTTDFVVLTSQQASVFDVDPTGGNVTATLPSAVTAGDNFRVTFKHTGTANSVTIQTVSSQTIDGATTYTLEDQYEGVTLVSDGANWLISESARLTPDVAQPIAAGYKNLVIKNNASTPNSQIDIDADAVTVETTAGKAYRLQSVNLTINCTTTGANALDAGGLANTTFYSTWVIYNPTTDATAGLASTSATSPALPSGYTAKARLGWMRTNGSAQFLVTLQKGNRAQYFDPPAMASGSASVWTAVATGSYVPSTAASIIGSVATIAGSSGTAYAMAAPNSSHQSNHATLTDHAPAHAFAYNSNGASVTFEFMLESSNIYWGNDSSNSIIRAVGWTDNI